MPSGWGRVAVYLTASQPLPKLPWLACYGQQRGNTAWGNNMQSLIITFLQKTCYRYPIAHLHQWDKRCLLWVQNCTYDHMMWGVYWEFKILSLLLGYGMSIMSPEPKAWSIFYSLSLYCMQYHVISYSVITRLHSHERIRCPLWVQSLIKAPSPLLLCCMQYVYCTRLWASLPWTIRTLVHNWAWYKVGQLHRR